MTSNDGDTNVSHAAFATYAATIERDLRAGTATEHTHRTALKSLLETLDTAVLATNEPKRVLCGAPDYVVTRTQRSWSTDSGLH